MATAEVGSLRVNLAMNASEFKEGTKDATNSLDAFALRIGVVAGIAAAAAEKIIEWFGKAMAKVQEGLTAGIDRAAEFADAADELGISIEDVAAIAIQGKVGVDTLTKGIKDLNTNMLEVASGDTTSKAARSFAALGVAATDAAGNIRPAFDVFADIAEKFKGYADGAQKSALATNIFGANGAALIPVLNEGRDAIDELKEKATETGIVFDENVGKAAQNLKENMKLTGGAFETFSNKLAVLTLPLLDRVVQKFVDLAEGSTLATDFATLLATAFDNVVAAGVRTIATIERLWTEFQAFTQNVQSLITGQWSEIAERNRVAAAHIEKIMGDMNNEITELFRKATDDQSKVASTHKDLVAAPMIASIQSIKTEQDEWNKSVAAGVALAQKSLSPYELLAKQLDQLSDAYDAGKISAELLAQAQQKAGFVAANAYASMASNIAGSLEKVFAGSKAVAIASALVNTYESVTKALAAYPPPFSFVAAGAALAAGLVQVANIRKTTKTSSGGGGGGSVGAPPEPAQAGVGVQQSLLVQGINPGDIFTGDVMKTIATKLLDFQRDGGKVVFA